MAHFLNTPQTEHADRTRMTMIDFSEIPSFVAPAGEDDLVKAAGGRTNARYAPLRTPSTRAPLARRPNPPAKQEFTPLLKSAMKKSMASQFDYNPTNSTTPAPSRLPNFTLSSPVLPERSMLGESEMTSDHSHMPIPESSSSMGTPLPALPNRGELGLNNGNLLTLKEQEAKLEQIDKENFGLKLKIHFLEEHLKKSGTEYNQDTIKQNTELRANQLVLEREIKKYLKQLKLNEVELEQYHLQLEQFKEKVRNRHMNEAMRDELESYKSLAEQRERELHNLRAEMENLKGSGNTENLDAAQAQVEELEADLQEKQRTIDEKEDQIEDLEAQLREAQNNDDLTQKDDKIEAQQEEIEQLQQELQQMRQDREELDDAQDALDALKRDHAVEMQRLQSQLELARKEARENQQGLEAQLATTKREKEIEVDSLQRRMQNLEEEKASDIESLEVRLRLAQSQGDNQSNLVQEAAAEAQEKIRAITLKKDVEIEQLQAQIDSYLGMKDELDLVRRQWQDANEDVARLQQEVSSHTGEAADLRDELAERTRDLRSLRSPSKNQNQASAEQVERLQGVLSERTDKIIELQRTIESQATSLEELTTLRSQKLELEQRIKRSSQEAENLKIELSDRDRQLDTVRKTLQDRVAELDVLRNAPDEPHTQLEGLQSIVRHRDQDLVDLREKLNQQSKDLETFQLLADERLKSMDTLKEQFAIEKADLQDEIEVLECSLDEAEEKISNLAEELQAMQSPRKFNQLQDKLHAQEREKAQLKQDLDVIRRDQSAINADRLALQDTISKLRADLQSAQTAAKDASPLPRGSSAELTSLRLEQRDLASRLKDAEQALTLAMQRHATATADCRALRSQLRERDAKLDSLQVDTVNGLTAGAAKAQEAREEAGRLAAVVVDGQRRHAAELKGMAKQITVLRARMERERMFRGELAFQKQWFMMMVGMYDECNANNIRMIEEMGITPDHNVRSKRPTIKTVAHSFIFCLRVKRASAEWAESKRMQEALTKKMEAMKAVKARAKKEKVFGR